MRPATSVTVAAMLVYLLITLNLFLYYDLATDFLATDDIVLSSTINLIDSKKAWRNNKANKNTYQYDYWLNHDFHQWNSVRYIKANILQKLSAK
ncbi:hypothetical protein MASR2M36_35130 [Providencia sp.]